MHLHVDVVTLPDAITLPYGDVMLLCSSHERRWASLMKQRRVKFVRYEIG